MTLTRISSGNVDPVSGTRLNPVEKTFSVYGVKEENKIAFANAVNGVISNDLFYMVDPTVEPLVGDKLTISGQVFSVSNVESQTLKSVVLFYNVRLKK